MTEALARPRPRIDDSQELDCVVRRLVEAYHPVAIYLFGSRARGDADADSDYDLMLVLADDNERVRSRQEVWQTARSRRIFVPRSSSGRDPSPGVGARSGRWSTRCRSMASGCIG